MQEYIDLASKIDEILKDPTLPLKPEESMTLLKAKMQLVQIGYRKQLDEFKDFLILAPGEDSDTQWDEFTNIDFVITFGDKSVTIYNGAEIYESICDIVDMARRYIE